MKKLTVSVFAIALLSACGAGTVPVNSGSATVNGLNNTGYLYNGNNISFVESGQTSCTNGVVAVPGYPLRCGPQAQATQ
ncbi:MAG: hypothetical protein AAGL89_13825 [Pseudomonadota bacterium]